MKTVTVKAMNVQKGDIYEGRRIQEVIQFRKRSRKTFPQKGDNLGVLIVTPNPAGYDLDTFKFTGSERVKVKRAKR
jgi:hypothetical protein